MEQNLKAKFEALCDEQEKTYKPQFEAVFQALFQIDDEQRQIYNTQLWDMGKPLPDKADENKIRQALKQAGFADDEGFCTAFLRYANLVIEGKKTQQAGAFVNAREQMEQHQADPPTVKGWKFKPMAIVAPVEFHGTIIQAVFECANTTIIPDESIDVLLDELAMAEAFNMKCSLTGYINDLRRCRVILDDGSFFDRDKTRLLFATLKKAVGSMKDNTNKPETVKAEIADIIKGFDNIQFWGLFFQILTLQGLLGLLLELDLNEGDTGYNEAQSLCDWVLNMLLWKESVFCTLPYGENDLKRLEPFCEYLINTEAGQFVQKALFGNDEQPAFAQPPIDEQTRPDEQPANSHFNAPYTKDELTTIFERLKNGRYLPADSDLQDWLVVCGAETTNAPVTPLKWLKGVELLGWLVYSMFPNDKANYWAITANCFRVKGKAPNTNTMKNAVSRVVGNYKDKPKAFDDLENLLRV